MRKQKRALFNSALSLLLCFSMLLGTTWAWFTDSVSSTNNIIKSGKLDVEMSWSDTKDGTFKDASTGAIFDYEYWEPGFTQIKYVKIDNVGNLAFRYVLNIIPNTMPAAGEVNLADVIDVYLVDTSKGDITRETLAGLTPVGTLSALMADSNGAARGVMLPVEGATNVTLNESDKTIAQTGTATYCIALKMQESAGNEYQDKTVGGGFAVQLLAAQYTYENDTFGNDFDTDSEWPGLGLESSATGTATVTVTDGKVDTAATISTNTEITATVPKDVAVDSNTLTLTVSEKETTDSGLTTGTNEELMALDVHIDGVSEGNETAIIIALGKVLPVGMNMGNVALYHVEDGKTNVMTQVETLADLDEHNEFYYDPATGEVTVAMATFSEVAMTMDTENAWNGEYDYSWYTNAVALLDGEATVDYTIANADQLAAFGAIVGGMAEGIEIDDFSGKTVKLISDINLGDKDNVNESLIFHPIGYYYTDDKNEDGTTGDYYSTVSSFGGTFDGNGHTIANFYQNTWEIKGDYDGNYYKDAMGLFGYVVNGKVCNLTVDNFSSDGEFTPTGVIAAYAVNSTFENIAITNCNPRVYNTGNGGIVGIGGNSDDPETYKLTFTNITIDNTNKISALWGSWDVACGGLVGMFRGAGHVSMTNCHVAAQIDVYNDVCGNYQYYWYRYAGMMVGTNKNMVTDSNGYTVPETEKYHAENCTVHFGDWNDYYYCELVANSLASYTHDHQFSRLEQIQNVSEIQDANGNWNKTGNFILMTGKTPTNTCYHIMKDANGNLYEHKHNVADATNPEINEVVNGETVLKENNQRIYLPFNQLFTGYGWGVKHVPVYNGEGYAFEGITILDREVADSVDKFAAKDNVDMVDVVAGSSISIDALFDAVEAEVDIRNDSVMVSVTDLTKTGITADFTRGETWDKGTLKFNGTNGIVKITIQDYYFCNPTSIIVEVGEFKTTDRFAVAFPNANQLNRVGNGGTVALGKLFTAQDGIGENVTVTFETVTGATVDKTTVNATKSNWAAQTVQFSNTGIIKVTISDDNFSTPVTQYLEVVDATNVTGLSGTITSNVVLLNDCGLSSLTVSGRNTVYGNGFTCTYSGNGQYLNNGLKQGVITVSENGILDNLRIKATIYPSAYLYYKEVQGGPSSVEGDKTRYHYQLSTVVAKGNATIQNCYIYGGRNNIFIDTGNVSVKDTVLECGTVANVQIQSTSEYTVTFENVTTIQHQVNSTIGDEPKVMMGAGIVVGLEAADNPTIVLNGKFKQYNWVYESDKNTMEGYAALVIDAALKATEFNHTINGKTASNLGIIYLNDKAANVTNNTGLPYKLAEASMDLANENGKVYSLQGATADQIYWDYENADRTTINGLYRPQFKYDSTLGGQYIADNGGDEFCYREGDTIKVMFPSGDTKELNLAALVNIVKYTGQDLGLVVTCKDSKGNAVAVTDGKITLSEAEDYTVTYTVNDKLFYDKGGNKVGGSEKYSWDVAVSVSLKDASVPNAYFEFDSKMQIMGYGKKSGLSGIGKSNFQYLPFLAGLKIYDYNGQNSYLRFDGDKDFNKIAKVELKCESDNAYITVTLTDGGVIQVEFFGRADSGSSTKTGTIQTSNNTVYYLTDGDTGATTTTWTIDSYTFTGNNGVEIEDTKQVFNNCVSGTLPSGSFSTTIKYTVSYDANGGDCGQTLGYATSTSSAVTLPTPTRAGYTFLGWYTAATGGTRCGGASDSYTPSANITLYAQWGAPCTVTYDANGGSCGTTSEKFDGKTLVLPEATKDGYTFLGWYTAATGGDRIGAAGASYNPTADITLYAQWGAPCTVTYDANGGSCETESELYDGVLFLPTATRTGYKFLGWYTATSGGTKIGDAGATYTPSANITLYAQWEKTAYTITVTTSNATVSGVTNGQTAYYGDTITFTVTYSGDSDKKTTVTDANGNTVNTTGSYTFTMPASNVTISASSSCVTPDTLITLADGTQVRVDSLTGDEELLVWNMETGALDSAPILFVDSETEAEFEIVHLYFSDGTDVKVIYEHGFWDYDLNKYVYLDRYAENYIGHTFAKQNGDSLEKVKLVDVVIETEVTTAWSPVTEGHLCYFVNGMLSMPGGVGGLFNIFDVDAETMTYDYEAMAADIEKYGLFTYEELNAIEPLSEEMFNAAGGAYLKISIGKGNLTMDELTAMIRRYSKFFE